MLKKIYKRGEIANINKDKVTSVFLTSGPI